MTSPRDYRDLLTVGIAHYQDPLLWATLEALHTYHPRVSYLVIDNAPAPDMQARGVTGAVGGYYYHRPDLNGTSAPRDALFRLAKTPWVMSIDSHILLEPGALQTLLDYLEAHRESNDLLAGPLVYDDGLTVCTHWNQPAPPALWGTWISNTWQDREGQTFTIELTQSGPAFFDLDGNSIHIAHSRKGAPRPGQDIRPWAQANHWTFGGHSPFEIPMHGLGLFAMRKDAWHNIGGFHPFFQGFGGEEGYLHAKVRRAGHRCLCIPQLRWRHKFRHMEHGASAPPYPLHPAHMCWNQLLSHRELGIECEDLIREHHGKDRTNVPDEVWNAMIKAAAQIQPLGVLYQRKRLKLLGIWYTHNQAPESMLRASLATIKRAADETMHHEVRVVTSTWSPVAGNPFPCVAGKPHAPRGHTAMVEQMLRAVKHADKSGYQWDALVFLEHDALYPPCYFDKMGNAFYQPGKKCDKAECCQGPDPCDDGCGLAPVVSNWDYEGCNATGFLRVRERHEPLYQLALRRDVALANFVRCEAECKQHGWTLLEPDSAPMGVEGAPTPDRSHWVRIPPQGLTPTIHINW
jgi:hypothetical protein